MSVSQPPITWKPINGANYWHGTGIHPKAAVVCHTAQGTLGGEDTWVLNPAAQASANFMVGRDGAIHGYIDPDGSDSPYANGKMQREDAAVDALYAASGYRNPNDWTVSIEHDDQGHPGLALTAAQLDASAHLAAYYMERYGIPLDDNHVLGHYEFDNVDRAGCPGWTAAQWQQWEAAVAAYLTEAPAPDPTAQMRQDMYSARTQLAPIPGLLAAVSKRVTDAYQDILYPATGAGIMHPGDAGTTTLTPPVPANLPDESESQGGIVLSRGVHISGAPPHNLLNILSGINVPPQVVGFARGIVSAAGVAAIEAAINSTGMLHLSPDQAVWLPLIVLGLRTFEGMLDGGKRQAA